MSKLKSFLLKGKHHDVSDSDFQVSVAEIIKVASLVELKDADLHTLISELDLGSHRKHILRKHILEQIVNVEMGRGVSVDKKGGGVDELNGSMMKSLSVERSRDLGQNGDRGTRDDMIFGRLRNGN